MMFQYQDVLSSLHLYTHKPAKKFYGKIILYKYIKIFM